MIEECVFLFDEYLYEFREVLDLDEATGFRIKFLPTFLVFFKGFFRDSHILSVIAIPEAFKNNGYEEVKEDEGNDDHER